MSVEGDTHVQHAGHGRDVQTKKTTTDTCKKTYDVLVGCRQHRRLVLLWGTYGVRSDTSTIHVSKLETDRKQLEWNSHWA